MPDLIKPGPCPPVVGCPPTTEIDCIEVLKVYDQCFREEISFGTFDLPEDLPILRCDIDFSPDASGLPATRCEIANIGPPDANNFRSIIARQIVRINIVLIDNSVTPARLVTVTRDVAPFYTDAFLYSPNGTFAQCELVAAKCECERLPGTPPQALCKIKVCKIIEIKALVKLLVPTYGFCQPAPCQPTPQVGFICPPYPLFPPQLEQNT
ncbi:MAG: hypothetical protein HPY81_03035 [Firmicutes bacterium]|nr:hypothetical protein [Bacillota bacterium]